MLQIMGLSYREKAATSITEDTFRGNADGEAGVTFEIPEQVPQDVMGNLPLQPEDKDLGHSRRRPKARGIREARLCTFAKHVRVEPPMLPNLIYELSFL